MWSTTDGAGLPACLHGRAGSYHVCLKASIIASGSTSSESIGGRLACMVEPDPCSASGVGPAYWLTASDLFLRPATTLAHKRGRVCARVRRVQRHRDANRHRRTATATDRHTDKQARTHRLTDVLTRARAHARTRTHTTHKTHTHITHTKHTHTHTHKKENHMIHNARTHPRARGRRHTQHARRVSCLVTRPTREDRPPRSFLGGER